MFSRSHFLILPEDEALPENLIVTWKNLKEMYRKYWDIMGFAIFYRRKGRLISWYEPEVIDYIRDIRCRDIAEWKTPELEINLQITYEQKSFPLKTILHYHDGDKAIQYVKERYADEFPFSSFDR